MKRAVFGAIGALLLGACAPMGGAPYLDGPAGLYEVSGVEEGDLLKLRAGPGTGFDVISGLPNGTRVRVTSCERSGAVRWCKAFLDDARALDGYLSFSYLRPL